MSNSTARDGDITRLHPMIRAKVAKIRETLHKEGHAFEVFEAFRTPERQNELYARGPQLRHFAMDLSPVWRCGLQ